MSTIAEAENVPDKWSDRPRSVVWFPQRAWKPKPSLIASSLRRKNLYDFAKNGTYLWPSLNQQLSYRNNMLGDGGEVAGAGGTLVTGEGSGSSGAIGPGAYKSSKGNKEDDSEEPWEMKLRVDAEIVPDGSAICLHCFKDDYVRYFAIGKMLVHTKTSHFQGKRFRLQSCEFDCHNYFPHTDIDYRKHTYHRDAYYQKYSKK